MFVVSKIKYAIFRSLWYVYTYMFEGLSLVMPSGMLFCYVRRGTELQGRLHMRRKQLRMSDGSMQNVSPQDSH
jgi:hypothetical protein